MARVLSERFGEVVDPHSLATSLAKRRLTPDSVRVHLTRLRKRIAPVGLVIRTVRGRGVVLDRVSLDDQRPRRLRSSPTLEVDSVVRPCIGRPGAHGNRPVVTIGNVFVIGDLVIDSSRHSVDVGERRVALTPTEFRFLSVLAQHHGELVPYGVIHEQVWGRKILDSQSLRTCVYQIRKKLNDDPVRPRLITEPRLGYRLVAPLENST
jgi:DNA-binding response OmpR family regulator